MPKAFAHQLMVKMQGAAYWTTCPRAQREDVAHPTRLPHQTLGVGELLARVRVAQRRIQRRGGRDPVFRFGEVSVDLAARAVSKFGVEVHLTPLEYRLLTCFITNAGKVLTHRQLLLEVWGPSHVESSHYLRIYMSQFRQKLEDDPTQLENLLTETAVGFRLVS